MKFKPLLTIFSWCFFWYGQQPTVDCIILRTERYERFSISENLTIEDNRLNSFFYLAKNECFFGSNIFCLPPNNFYRLTNKKTKVLDPEMVCLNFTSTKNVL